MCGESFDSIHKDSYRAQLRGFPSFHHILFHLLSSYTPRRTPSITKRMYLCSTHVVEYVLALVGYRTSLLSLRAEPPLFIDRPQIGRPVACLSWKTMEGTWGFGKLVPCKRQGYGWKTSFVINALRSLQPPHPLSLAFFDPCKPRFEAVSTESQNLLDNVPLSSIRSDPMKHSDLIVDLLLEILLDDDGPSPIVASPLGQPFGSLVVRLLTLKHLDVAHRIHHLGRGWEVGNGRLGEVPIERTGLGFREVPDEESFRDRQSVKDPRRHLVADAKELGQGRLRNCRDR